MDNDNALNSIKNNTNSPPETEEKPEISSADEKPETDPSTAPVEETVVVAEEEVVSESEPEPAPNSEPEKPAEDPAPEPILPETPVFDPAQPLPSTEPKKKKSKFLPLLVIILLLLLGACGACYYIIVYRPDLNPFRKPAPTPAKLEPSEPEETEEEVEAEEVAITDEATKSALFEKLLTLHAVTDNQIASNPNYKFGETFIYYLMGNPIDKFYSMTATDSDKIDQTIASLKSTASKSLQELGVPEDIYNSQVPEDQIDYLKDFYTYGTGIEASIVAEAYKKMYGKEIKHQSSKIKCFGLLYSEEYNLYYTQPGGCGGVSPVQTLFVSSYSKKGNKYYVDVAISDMTNPEEEITVITSDNYKNFSQYRFVFEDDGTGNYVYKTTEKLN